MIMGGGGERHPSSGSGEASMVWGPSEIDVLQGRDDLMGGMPLDLQTPLWEQMQVPQMQTWGIGHILF